MRFFGNLLVAASLLGLLVIGLIAAEVTPPWALESPARLEAAPPLSAPALAIAPPLNAPVRAAPLTAGRAAAPTTAVAASTADAIEAAGAPGAAAPAQPRPAASAGVVTAPAPLPPPAEPRRPIDRIAVPSIGLDAPVVTARLVDRAGALTWEIPARRAGHADGTAGAGAPGNAVLLGHVDSLRSGDVFRNLEKVAVGDAVTVWSGDRAYTYRVVEAHAVGRADTALVGTTEAAALTLVTCAGAWSPALWDYTERFVVRAELAEVAGG
ncbi:MAG TPA: sortase [Chloroflexota bacterium]